MRIDILTLFPEMCSAVMNESIIGRAQKAGKVEIVCTNIRDFAGNKHNKVDDTPYGGGMGMIMALFMTVIKAFITKVNPSHIWYIYLRKEQPLLKKKRLNFQSLTAWCCFAVITRALISVLLTKL